jgi:hypothetical protein
VRPVTKRQPTPLQLGKRPVRTGMVLAYQSSGEFLRWNPHYHCIVLEGGFDERGKFVHIPLGDIKRMSEYFRRVIIKFFLKQQLISARIATGLINWRHSGFSVDASVRIPAFSDQARGALSQYIARPPLSLKKIGIKENGDATAVSFTSQSEFFKGKTETFPVMPESPRLTAFAQAALLVWLFQTPAEEALCESLGRLSAAYSKAWQTHIQHPALLSVPNISVPSLREALSIPIDGPRKLNALLEATLFATGVTVPGDLVRWLRSICETASVKRHPN